MHLNYCAAVDAPCINVCPFSRFFLPFFFFYTLPFAHSFILHHLPSSTPLYTFCEEGLATSGNVDMQSTAPSNQYF